MGIDTRGSAEMRKQQGLRLKGRSAVKPHRGEQDLGYGKEVERERFQEKRGSKEKYMRKLDQTPTSLVQLPGASKQLLLYVDERVNRSWERADSVKNSRECR